MHKISLKCIDVKQLSNSESSFSVEYELFSLFSFASHQEGLVLLSLKIMCVIVNLSRTHLIFRRLQPRSYAHSVVIGQLALE